MTAVTLVITLVITLQEVTFARRFGAQDGFSAREIADYAHQALGIDPVFDFELLWIAEEVAPTSRAWLEPATSPLLAVRVASQLCRALGGGVCRR